MALVTVEQRIEPEGWWSESGGASWLPREFHATRGKARAWAEKETGVFFLDFSVGARHVRFVERDEVSEGLWDEYDGNYVVVCGAAEPGAIPVWELTWP